MIKPLRTQGLNLVEDLGHAHRLSLPKGPERSAICVHPLPGGDAQSFSVDVLNALDRRSWSRAHSIQKEDPEKRAALWLRSAEIQNLFVPNADWMNEEQLLCAGRLSKVCAVWLLFAGSSQKASPTGVEAQVRAETQLEASAQLRLERASLALALNWARFPDVPRCGPLEFRASCGALLTDSQLTLVDEAMAVGGGVTRRAIAHDDAAPAIEVEILRLGDGRWKSIAMIRGAQLAALGEGWRLSFDTSAWETRWTGGSDFAPHEVEMLSAMYDPFVAGMYVLMRCGGLGAGGIRDLKCQDLRVDRGGVALGDRGLELPSDFLPIIRALVATQCEGSDPAAPLFRTKHGTEMRPSGVRQRIEAFCERTALARPRGLISERDSERVAMLTEFRPLVGRAA